MNQIDRLLTIMQRLRDPENGCPWDKEQTFATIAPYTLEETYEVLDAIAREDRHLYPSFAFGRLARWRSTQDSRDYRSMRGGRF